MKNLPKQNHVGGSISEVFIKGKEVAGSVVCAAAGAAEAGSKGRQAGGAGRQVGRQACPGRCKAGRSMGEGKRGRCARAAWGTKGAQQ